MFANDSALPPPHLLLLLLLGGLERKKKAAVRSLFFPSPSPFSSSLSFSPIRDVGGSGGGGVVAYLRIKKAAAKSPVCKKQGKFAFGDDAPILLRFFLRAIKYQSF